MHTKDKIKKDQGFTLVELMTAVSIFLIIMTISMGSILSIFDANRKSRSMRAVMTNLNLALESMSREMRYGVNYHCGTQGLLTAARNCANGDDFMSFLSSEGEQVVYRSQGSAIEKSVNSGASYTVVTAPEIIVDNLAFFTVGAGTSGQNGLLQPKVVIRIQGHAGSGKSQSNFTVQTLVSQRALDN